MDPMRDTSHFTTSI